MSPLIECWLIHDRIHRYFLDALPEGGWDVKLEKGKAVSSQFIHVHNVRLMWLKAIDPTRLEGLAKLEPSATPVETGQALSKSAMVIAEVVDEALASGKRIKNFKPSTEAFVGYLISHESHHRGQAEIALRQAGLPIDDKISFGLWEWGTR